MRFVDATLSDPVHKKRREKKREDIHKQNQKERKKGERERELEEKRREEVVDLDFRFVFVCLLI